MHCVADMDVDLLVPPPLKRKNSGERRRTHAVAASATASGGDGAPVVKRRPAASLPRPPRATVSDEDDAPRLLTLCSGLEAIVMALENLLVRFRHVGSCEKDQHTVRVIEHNFDPGVALGDICEVLLRNVPEHDLLVCGFPCQPFSAEGMQEGMLDAQGRGLVILYVIRIVEHRMPPAVILENVKGLLNRTNRPFFDAILSILRGITKNGLRYIVEWRVLDSKFFRLPHSRPRLYIVAIRSDKLQGSILWPVPHDEACQSIDSVLEGERPSRMILDSAQPTETYAQTHLRNAKAKVTATGCDPLVDTHIVEVDSSDKRSTNVMRGCSPCLTKRRAEGSGHWVARAMVQ